MNAPDRYERFVVPEGMSKVGVSRDTKIINAASFVIQREDHTIGNLIRMQLHKDPSVYFAGYKLPHPLKYEVEVKIQSSITSSPVQTYNNALIGLDAEFSNLRRAVVDAINEKRERDMVY